jgi:hypothetical protein
LKHSGPNLLNFAEYGKYEPEFQHFDLQEVLDNAINRKGIDL